MSSDRERIDARLAAPQKELIEKAAGLAGLSVASFVVSSAIEHAQAVIEQHTRTMLSIDNARRLAHILERDEPTPSLLAAAKRHRARRAKR